MTFLKHFRSLRRSFALGLPALLAALVCFSCNTGGEGDSFLKVHIDSTWLGYDSLQVLLDKGDGKGPQRIFGGKVDAVSDLDKIPVNGYDGGKVSIVIRGYKGDSIARAEGRGYDGSRQQTVEVTVIVKPGGQDSNTTVKLDGLSLSLLPRDTLVTIGDSVSYRAEAKNASGTLSEAEWDLDGDGVTDLVVNPGTANSSLSAGFLFPADGVFHPSVTIKGSNGSSLIQKATVRVALDAPTADAGPDLVAQAGTDITLSGAGKDSLGRIVKQEWRVGSGAFQDAPLGKLTYRTPSTAGDVIAIFRVTDDDRLTAQDTAVIHVTVSPDTTRDGLLLHLTSADTLISIGDSAVYAAMAKNAGGKLTKAAWDLDGNGTPDLTVTLDSDSAQLTAGFRYTKVGTYHPTVTFTGARGETLKDTLTIKVLLDAPQAEAGPDVTTAKDSSVTLAGKAGDGIGKIVKQEWSLAGGAFAATPDGKTVYTPTSAGDFPAIFRVTDDDGQTAVDTAVIHVISPSVAALTEFGVAGCPISPAFNPDSLGYACPAPFGTASVTVTAKAQGTMTLNGTALPDGKATPVTLTQGKATLTLKVTNGPASRTYTVNVTSAAASGNNALSALALSPGALAQVFAPATLAYSVIEASSVASVTVTATLADTTASLSINSVAATSGKVSAAIALGAAAKVIPIVVTAQNGQVRSYSVTVTRRSGNANLKTLALSQGVITPLFAAGTLAYTDTVGESLASLNLTAVPEDTANAVMSLNGSPLAANKATVVALTLKETVINLVVKAEDPAVTRTYVIKVIKVDDIPPSPPTAVLGPYAAPDRPTWSWTAGGGGNGNFRYKIDNTNLESGATATTATSFSPAADLGAGIHTLYVQERDSAGNWSASGKAAVTLAALKGVSDYPFQGHAADTLGKNADAAVTGAPFLAQGIYSNGIYPGGVPNSSDATTPILAGFTTSSFAVELDFKPDGLPEAGENVIMGGTSYRWLGATLDSDGKLSMLYNNSSSVKGTVTCAADAWHTLRLAYTGGTATLTVDGTVTASITVALTFGGDYEFSTNNYSNGSNFKGNWRNLRVYAGSIKIAHYPLSGDARDITGKQTVATLTNTPYQSPGPGATLAGVYNTNDISTPVLAGMDTTDFRVTAEFAIAALPATQMPVVTGGNLYRWLGARIESDGSLTLVYNNLGLKTTTTKVSLTAKHTVSLRYSVASAVASIYLDGTLAGTQSVPTLTIGKNTNVTTTNYGNGSAFKGTLYRFRVDGK